MEKDFYHVVKWHIQAGTDKGYFFVVAAAHLFLLGSVWIFIS